MNNLYILRSQSSLDSTNGFAFVANDLNKDLEQKTMREYRNDINVKDKSVLFVFFLNLCFSYDRCMKDYMIFFLNNIHLIILCVKYEKKNSKEKKKIFFNIRNVPIHFWINLMLNYKWQHMN